MPKNKPIERICKNCKLFDPSKGSCSVVILHEGEKIKLPVDPEDPCFFEEEYFDPITQSTNNFSDEIQEIKFWVEGPDGQKTDKNGIVKIEYPENLFSRTLKNFFGFK